MMIFGVCFVLYLIKPEISLNFGKRLRYRSFLDPIDYLGTDHVE